MTMLVSVSDLPCEDTLSRGSALVFLQPGGLDRTTPALRALCTPGLVSPPIGGVFCQLHHTVSVPITVGVNTDQGHMGCLLSAYHNHHEVPYQ